MFAVGDRVKIEGPFVEDSDGFKWQVDPDAIYKIVSVSQAVDDEFECHREDGRQTKPEPTLYVWTSSENLTRISAEPESVSTTKELSDTLNGMRSELLAGGFTEHEAFVIVVNTLVKR